MKKSILSILFTLIVSSPLFAQNGTAIRGVVTDENGAKVAGAQVVLNITPGVQLIMQTNQAGSFEYKGLRSGSYLLEVKAEGFSSFTSESIKLERGESKEVPVQLKLAAINASVVVTSTGTPERADEIAKVVSTLDSETVEAK